MPDGEGGCRLSVILEELSAGQLDHTATRSQQVTIVGAESDRTKNHNTQRSFYCYQAHISGWQVLPGAKSAGQRLIKFLYINAGVIVSQDSVILPTIAGMANSPTLTHANTVPIPPAGEFDRAQITIPVAIYFNIKVIRRKNKVGI